MISEKTVERLSVYRRLLEVQENSGREYVYSHELAELVSGTAAQVRRDLMELGVTGHSKRGYLVSELVRAISRIIDTPDGTRVVLVGVGDLGRAVLGFLKGFYGRMQVVAAFDNDPLKIGRVMHGYRCQSVTELAGVVMAQHVQTAIVTTPAHAAQHVSDHLVAAGIRGILNLAPTPVHVPPDVYVERVDLATALEKVTCLARLSEGVQERETAGSLHVDATQSMSGHSLAVCGAEAST